MQIKNGERKTEIEREIEGGREGIIIIMGIYDAPYLSSV